jgi:hypothetical protein
VNDCFENEACKFDHFVGSGMIEYATMNNDGFGDDNVTSFLTDDEDGYYAIASQVSGSSQICVYKRNLTNIVALHNVLYYV